MQLATKCRGRYDSVGALCDNRDNNAMGMFPEPAKANSFLARHVAILQTSLNHWTNRELLKTKLDCERYSEQLYRAPFAVVSHDTMADPVFNYANLTAQRLFELSWANFTALPSRLSAEPANRNQRARLLADVSANGYSDDYRGVRISSSGKRFRIVGATVWNLVDADKQPYGQAAMFAQWEFL